MHEASNVPCSNGPPQHMRPQTRDSVKLCELYSSPCRPLSKPGAAQAAIPSSPAPAAAECINDPQGPEALAPMHVPSAGISRGKAGLPAL